MTRFADAPVERHYEGAQLAGTEGFVGTSDWLSGEQSEGCPVLG
jgi:hypothetical protein